MKHLKKLASMALALVMVLALAVPAFAANPYVPTKVNLTINATENNELTVYQVFTGEPLKGADGKFNQKFDHVAWGSSFTTEGQRLALVQKLKDKGALDGKLAQDAYMVDGKVSAQKLAELLSVADTNEHMVEAKRISEAVSETAKQESITGIPMASGQAKLLETGYYTVVDTLTQEDKNPVTIYSALNLVTDMQTDSKNKPDTVPDEPNVAKFIRSEDGKTWEKIDDVSKVQEFEFKIETVLNQEFQKAVDSQNRGDDKEDTNFNLVFTDTQSTYLKMPETSDIHVYYLKKGADESTATEVELSAYPGNPPYVVQKTATGFIVTMDAMDRTPPFNTLEAGDKIILKYKTKLVDNISAAEILAANGAFKNDISLNYNGKTVNDDATAITFTLEIDKIDGDAATKTYLSGAEFTLYKLAAGFTKADGSYTEEELGEGRILTAGAPGQNTDKDQLPGAVFTFDGLKAGDYVLKETVVPNGYNKASDIYLKIVAEYGDVSGERVLKGYSVKQVNADGSAIANIPDITGTVVTIKDAANQDTNVKAPGSALVKEVENNSGVLLPSTGGIGTTIFYIVGGVLLIGAVVLLIAKRRTSADDE